MLSLRDLLGVEVGNWIEEFGDQGILDWLYKYGNY